MKNIIYTICEKLRGFSDDKEYFEILQITPKHNNEYVVIVKLVDTEAKTTKEISDESNQ
ncbi:MAG: hypothetical protein ACTTJ6_09275 [Treponema sp.]